VNPESKCSKCSICAASAANAAKKAKATKAEKAANNLLLCAVFAFCSYCFRTHELLLAFVSDLHSKTVASTNGRKGKRTLSTISK
jgi:hypothetical protein